MKRIEKVRRFYSLLDRLRSPSLDEATLGTIARGTYPQRGVYFFFELGESRSDSGSGLRVVRIGTHALTATSRSTLGQRLRQHRGTVASGGGNHRGSVFRLLVGEAAARRDPALVVPSWGAGSTAKGDSRTAEAQLEHHVSVMIGAMQLLWLGIDDPPGAASLRGVIERNSIALLSNYRRSPLDPPSPAWLGLCSARERVRASGLWNQRHVDEQPDQGFLDVFERVIEARK